MVRNHMSLHDLCSGMTMFPQILVNVRYTSSEIDPLEDEQVKSVTAEVEAAWAIVAACCCVNPVLNH
jgi:phosphoglucosamine mutase